ncbi:nucleobase:cation symporter-2 family protein [Gluconobacter cerinus]|uniref:nucleobase:cation symporter-2 family protein n=1 Tax=Gluconobacter cerinus TaxID=38307 RepID=UPI001B8AD602|nr:nucleobase:cation symporter-2 family protein [Gluconobacter cerinus]MBS1068000.1 purine permease [Gluconobacter cerinus]
MASDTSAVHPVDEKLPLWRLGAYGFQHILAFYSAAVIVPILVAGALHLPQETLIHLIDADLFTCGIASLLQSVGFGPVGVRLPLLQGVTFTAVGPMIAIGSAVGGGTPGLLSIYGSVIVAGIVSLLIAPYFAKLVRFFPPVVTGSIILVIGLALLPVAANDIVSGHGPGMVQDQVPLRSLCYGLGTLASILVVQRLFRGFISTIAVLIGLCIGTLAAWLMGDAHFGGVASAPLVSITQPFFFGTPAFHVVPILSMVIVMVITMVETIGNVYATGEIVGKTITREDIARTLRADGIATLLGGVFNSFPYTCFAENVGLVRMTGVKSRWVVASAAVIMMMLGCLPKLGAIVAAVPLPVLGGAALAMFATVAVVGVQTLTRVDFNRQSNVIIVGTSIGLGMLATAQPHISDTFPMWAQIVFGSGITLGALSAIFLHLLFNVRRTLAVDPEAEIVVADLPDERILMGLPVEPEGPVTEGRQRRFG